VRTRSEEGNEEVHAQDSSMHRLEQCKAKSCKLTLFFVTESPGLRLDCHTSKLQHTVRGCRVKHSPENTRRDVFEQGKSGQARHCQRLWHAMAGATLRAIRDQAPYHMQSGAVNNTMQSKALRIQTDHSGAVSMFLSIVL
jgi:hypothetical protein